MQLTLPSDLRCIIFLSYIFPLKNSYVFILIFALWKDNSLFLSLSLWKTSPITILGAFFFPKSQATMRLVGVGLWTSMTRMHGCRSLLKSTISLVEIERGRGGGQLFIRGHVNSNNWRILITRFSNGARGRLAFISDEISLGRSGPKPPFPSC